MKKEGLMNLSFQNIFWRSMKDLKLFFPLLFLVLGCSEEGTNRSRSGKPAPQEREEVKTMRTLEAQFSQLLADWEKNLKIQDFTKLESLEYKREYAIRKKVLIPQLRCNFTYKVIHVSMTVLEKDLENQRLKFSEKRKILNPELEDFALTPDEKKVCLNLVDNLEEETSENSWMDLKVRRKLFHDRLVNAIKNLLQTCGQKNVFNGKACYVREVFGLGPMLFYSGDIQLTAKRFQGAVEWDNDRFISLDIVFDLTRPYLPRGGVLYSSGKMPGTQGLYFFSWDYEKIYDLKIKEKEFPLYN